MQLPLFQRFYLGASPALLLFAGWLVLVAAAAWRVSRGLPVPALNVILIPVGLLVYFIPAGFCPDERGRALQRKLLWLLLASGLILLAVELLRGSLFPDI
jgi:hypothetical protein